MENQQPAAPLVVLARGNDSHVGMIRGIHGHDSHERWHFALERDQFVPRNALAADRGVVYAATSEGLVYAVRAQDGDFVWQRRVTYRDPSGPSGNPVDLNYVRPDLSPNDTGRITVLRAKQYDDWIREFISEHPDAMVVYLGCGLDTRVMRIDPPPGVSWYDLDYPDVIALRERFFPKRSGYVMIASSVTDPGWLKNLPSDRPVMIVAEGMLEYLREQDVRTLLNRLTSHFQHGELAFDVLSSFAVRSGKSQLEATTGATHSWAVDDTGVIEQFDPKLKKISELSVFEVASMKELPWVFRVIFTSMRIFPRFRSMLRLLRYQF
jgi:O-methyltransferase involved in polyketide biosynthesis